MIKPDRVLCPICRDEFSYGFLRYGFGHVCKRNFVENQDDYNNQIIILGSKDKDGISEASV